MHSFLVAIIIPEPGVAIKWAKEKNLPENYDEICKNEEFKMTILKNLSSIGRNANRKGLEIIKNAYLSPIPFSIEDNTMTPTQKIKRFQAGKKYSKEIEQLYLQPPLSFTDKDK